MNNCLDGLSQEAKSKSNIHGKSSLVLRWITGLFSRRTFENRGLRQYEAKTNVDWVLSGCVRVAVSVYSWFIFLSASSLYMEKGTKQSKINLDPRTKLNNF